MKSAHVFPTFCAIVSLLGGLLASAPLPASAQTSASGAKTLHVMVTSPETELDPAAASDVTTLSLDENLFEPMLHYDYLARPVKLEPNTLTDMPVPSGDGKTYTMHLRHGIYFTPDPAFKGRRRELTAQDYVYSIKRLYDPAVKSPWLFLFDGWIAGDALLKAGGTPGHFDYDAPVAGLQAVDRYTLRIRLVAPDPDFLFKLAMPATGAVAREVIEGYPSPGNHPVGTGPFRVGEWRRNARILLVANRAWRETLFDGSAAGTPQARAIAAALRGKRLPRVDQVEVRVVEEPQARMLGFLSGQFDYLEQVPPELAGMVLDGDRLKPQLARQGVAMTRFAPPQLYYMWMNMEDAVIGGYGKDRIALRRAIAMSYDRREDIALNEKGLAIPAAAPLPPSVLGFDPAYRSPVAYDPAMANRLLDRFGYRLRDKTGYRMTPDGKPLTLVMHTQASTIGRTRDEVWRRCLQSIGIRVVFRSAKLGDIIKAARLGQVQMYDANWIADFPDGDNFYQLLYGPNSGRANYARFNQPEYNRLFEQARALPDSPQRTALYDRLNQLIDAYNPWVLRMFPISVDLQHGWVSNYLHHPAEFTAWRYVDIEEPARGRHTAPAAAGSPSRR